VYNNICQTCHRPGNVFAGNKPFAPADASVVFGRHTTNGQGRMRQISHRWDGSDTNPAAGAVPPTLAAMTTATIVQDPATPTPNLRGRTGNELACARCHSMHADPNSNGSLLRSANDQDQMCMDCHSPRNKQSHLDGTHPVGVNYAAKAAAKPSKFNPTPLKTNPSNPTADVGATLTSTGNVVCSTCHGVHFTDSKGSTVDGVLNYANISTGDGYLLRTDRRNAKVSAGQPENLNICTTCHAGKSNHNAKDQDVQCSDCHGTHVEYDKDDPNGTLGKNVFLIRRNVKKAGMDTKVYFRYTGSKREYRNDQGTGVCQGCHDVPPPGGVYPAEHASNSAADCNGCHNHASSAGSFSGACTKCHGMPPRNLAELAVPATNALGGAVGAHAIHYNRGMSCNTCHNGYTGRTMPSTTIDLGFAIEPGNVTGFKGSVASGTYYYNQSVLSNNYTFVGPGAREISQQPGAVAMTCNVYCHGNTLTPGTNPTPSWVSSGLTCTSCHSQDGTAMTMGSHNTHATGTSLNLTCDKCHGSITSTNHMNGSVRWDLGLLTTSPSATYQAVGGVTGKNGETNKLAPSTQYGSCSSIICHGQGSPTWGAKSAAPVNGFPYSTAQCGKCHSMQGDVSTANPFYSTAIPKVIVKTDAKVGAHTSHLASVGSASVLCLDCHGNVTLVSAANHMNGTTNFVWSDLATHTVPTDPTNIPLKPSYLNGTCSNTYCHGATLSGGTNKTPSWNSQTYLPATLSPAACATCHGFPPQTASGIHSTIATPTGFPTSSCGCHPNLNSNGTTYADIFIDKSKHINGLLEGGGKCDACHGYPPANKKFVASANNWEFAKMENYTGGGGAHTVAGHIPASANPADKWSNCSNCHKESDHAMSPLVFLPSSNIKVNIDQNNKFSVSRTAKYASNKLDGAAHVSGNCSNIACHFQKSPKW
jgi:predicted CxxxxCH...CXXCH cytochrome family protein